MGLGFPDWYYFEPAYSVEVEIIMCWALDQLQDRESGRSAYLRLTTNPIAQPEFEFDETLRQQVVAGGYWLRDYRGQADYRDRDNHVSRRGMDQPHFIPLGQAFWFHRHR